MTERMKQFFEAAIKNEKTLAVLKRLKALSFAEQRAQITALASSVGVTLTEDDFKQVDGAELTDEELEKTAGGGMEEMSLDDLMTLLTMLSRQADEERRAAYETAVEMQQ